MADVKISGLPASTVPLAGTEVLPIVQGGVTKQVAVSNLTAGRSVSVANLTNAGLTSGRVTYAGASGLLTDTSTFVFDGTNLGIGLTTPTSYAGYTGMTLLGGAAGAFLDLDNNLNTARFQLFTYAGATALNTINTNALTFGTQNTERMRVHASGGVSIGNTTDPGAGKLSVTGGVLLGTSTTALTDYAEGTWTPVVFSAGGSITSYTASGVYTKVGRVVTASFKITITNNGTGSAFVVCSIPFTSASTTTRYIGTGREDGLTGNQLQVDVNTNATNANIFAYDNSYPGGTNAVLNGTITYFV
jgi:hypothetical protein